LNIKINDNIVLIGTAHISQESVEEVKKVIEEYKPDIVAVELCQRRYDSITKKQEWENTPINKLLKGGNAYLLLAQTFLGSIQRKLGKEYGVEPGSEMVAAIDEAKKHNLKVALIDRDISITLKRAWKKMGLREKFRLTWEFLKAMLGYDEEELKELDLKKLMDQDVISSLMEEFGEIAPSVTTVLIHERDKYIAKKILDESKKGKVVAVVGAGHLKGIKEHLEKKPLEVNLEELEDVPKKRFSILKTIGYLIPVVFGVLIVYIFLNSGWENTFNALLWWLIITGGLSAIGAIIARAHPFSIIAAFFAAPIATLHPLIATGWVAGYVELKMRKPMVKDFKELSKIESLRDFWRNRVIRILMVIALTNLGAMIGTFVGLPYIASLTGIHL
jgi:pheromone shutdown-related protein TraB